MSTTVVKKVVLIPVKDVDEKELDEKYRRLWEIIDKYAPEVPEKKEVTTCGD